MRRERLWLVPLLEAVPSVHGRVGRRASWWLG